MLLRRCDSMAMRYPDHYQYDHHSDLDNKDGCEKLA